MKKIFLILILIVFGYSEFINPFETNISTENNMTTSIENNLSKEINTTNTLSDNNTTNPVSIETFKDSFKTLTPTVNIAVVINKKFFKKYLPSIINSLNAYFLYKNANYTIKVFNENNLTSALNYQYIFYFGINPSDVNILKNYSNYFYLPIINKNEVNSSYSNIFFGGIDYKGQINTLSKFIEKEKKIIAINSKTYLSSKIYSIEKKEFNTTAMMYPEINYYDLNNNYIFFNTAASKTAQVLSNINYKNITPFLEFSTQINYDPLLIEITQPQDVTKLIIANSIINVPPILEDYNQLLNTDIEFNWLNYSSTLLANKLYNQITQGDEFYLNDFKLYMFNNQINYKTKLYQIINNSFRVIY